MKMPLPKSFSAFSRVIFSLLMSALVLATALPAAAAGRVIWKSTSVDERTDNSSWRVDLEMHLPSAPDVPHVPMKFEFTPIAFYERSLADGQDKPQERTVPLTGQQTIIESVDVGFLDSGSGVTQSRTRFSMKLTRAHGFEAGEYKTIIRDSRNGQQVGSTQTLKLKGENEVIDRRSMVFQPSDRKKKKAEEKTGDDKTAEADQSSTAPADEQPSAQPTSGPSPGSEPTDAGNAPPSVEERPGGGCHHGPSHGEHLSWMFLALGGVALTWLRRKA